MVKVVSKSSLETMSEEEQKTEEKDVKEKEVEEVEEEEEEDDEEGEEEAGQPTMLQGVLEGIRSRVMGNDDEEGEAELNEQLQRLEQQQQAQVQQNIGNIFITEMLEAYPADRANSNKIILPHSMFKEIDDKKVWDNKPAGKPIIFQLEVADPETGDVIETTYAGVEDFTAPDGKVGLPHKTALSLTKERGVAWLTENPMVFLSYVNLPSHEESFMQIQPRGRGFHGEDDAVVNLDIKSILEKTLRDHIVLTRGDWIPIYHEGKWFELVVRDTRPEETLEVLNTDLEVDILPSEDTEMEQTAVQEAKDKLKRFMDARNERAKAKEQKLKGLKEPSKGDKSSILVRIRLPNGKSKQRRFEVESQFGLIMDWAEYEMYKAEFIPSELPESSPDDYWFKIVEKIPRKAARSLTGSDAWKTMKQVMSEGEGVRSGISLIVEVLKNKESKDSTDQKHAVSKKEPEGEEDTSSNEWVKAFENLQKRIEAGENEVEPEETIGQSEIDELAKRLTEYGVGEDVAKDNAAKYPKQLLQLESMGYLDKMNEAIALLDTHKGGINQTINALLQGSLVETTEEEVQIEEDGEEDDKSEES